MNLEPGTQVTPSVLALDVILGWKKYGLRGIVREVRDNLVEVEWIDHGAPEELGVEMVEVVDNG